MSLMRQSFGNFRSDINFNGRYCAILTRKTDQKNTFTVKKKYAFVVQKKNTKNPLGFTIACEGGGGVGGVGG